MIVSLTKDAYKILVNKEPRNLFDSQTMLQFDIEPEVILTKMKGYKINKEDKEVRVIKPLLTNNRVTDISVLFAVTDTLVFNRG